MFRFFFLLVFLVISPGLLQAAALTCNFDDDENINSKDTAIIMAWRTEYNLATFKNVEVKLEDVEKRASSILSQNIVVSRLPNQVRDKLADEDKIISTGDIVYLMAYVVEKNIADFKKIPVSFSNVEFRAQSSYSNLAPLSKLPGTPIGDSGFSTTITGIQTDL